MIIKKFIDNFRPEIKARILGLYIIRSNPYSDDTVAWWNDFEWFVNKNKNYIKNSIKSELYSEFEKLLGTEEYDKMDSILNEINLLDEL